MKTLTLTITKEHLAKALVNCPAETILNCLMATAINEAQGYALSRGEVGVYRFGSWETCENDRLTVMNLVALFDGRKNPDCLKALDLALPVTVELREQVTNLKGTKKFDV